MTSPLATLPSTAKEKPEGIAVTAVNSRDWDVKVVHDGKPEATIFRACQSPKRHKGSGARSLYAVPVAVIRGRHESCDSCVTMIERSRKPNPLSCDRVKHDSRAEHILGR